ncbi:MAG: RDD family protein [bacterium]
MTRRGSETSAGSRARRGLAALIDFLLALALAFLLLESTGEYFAARSVPTLHVGEPGTWWRGPVPLVLGLFGTLVYGFPFAYAAVLGTALLFGRTPGQIVARLEVVEASGESAPTAGAARSGDTATRGATARRRSLLHAAGPIGMTLALVIASWPLLAAAFLFGFFIATESAFATLAGGRSLVDRWSRTNVRERERA